MSNPNVVNVTTASGFDLEFTFDRPFKQGRGIPNVKEIYDKKKDLFLNVGSGALYGIDFATVFFKDIYGYELKLEIRRHFTKDKDGVHVCKGYLFEVLERKQWSVIGILNLPESKGEE